MSVVAVEEDGNLYAACSINLPYQSGKEQIYFSLYNQKDQEVKKKEDEEGAVLGPLTGFGDLAGVELVPSAEVENKNANKSIPEPQTDWVPMQQNDVIATKQQQDLFVDHDSYNLISYNTIFPEPLASWLSAGKLRFSSTTDVCLLSHMAEPAYEAPPSPAWNQNRLVPDPKQPYPFPVH
ncbi:hypothetical protein E2320_019357 [Naja naja]|nr:hypothetical protein E2320_019357 [Naja naja]